MQADFRPPKRRSRIREEYQGPLPVSREPGEGSACGAEGREFRGELINQHVLVCHPQHIQKIHNQGYLGKGVLSRARPEHSISERWQHHEGLFLPVVTQSRFELLLSWAEALLSARGLDQQAVGQALLRLSEPVRVEDVRLEVGEQQQLSGGPEEGSRTSSLQARPKPSSDQDSQCDPEPDPGLCVSVPGPGFVLVSSDTENITQINPMLPWRHDHPEVPMCGGPGELRRSPLSLTEYLQLSLEEAFFLVYSLGCLCIYLDQEPLSILQLWTRFCSLRTDFSSSFAAYQHFRSKGWIPKGGSGAKYGADFLLYRKGPPFYHASYSVVVQRVSHTYSGLGRRPFSWRSLAALSRITANVSKELLLCYVIYPADLSEQELDSPECLSRLTVQEVIVSRWVSSRERVEQEDI